MRSLHSRQYHLNIPLSLANNVAYVTLGASGHWLGTRIGAGSFKPHGQYVVHWLNTKPVYDYGKHGPLILVQVEFLFNLSRHG